MKNFARFWLPMLLLVVMAGCATQLYDPQTPQQNVLAVGSPRPASATASVTVTLEPTENPYLAISVKQTESALEQIQLDQQIQQLNADQIALNMQLTSDAATSTGVAAVTETHVAAVLQGNLATAGVTATLAAASSTAVAATRTAKILEQEYRTEVFSLWFFKVLTWAFFLFLAVGGVLGFKNGIEKITSLIVLRFSQIKPDAKGRYPIVPESAIPGVNKALLNPNAAHRVTVSRDTDDLSTEQALANTQAQRELEALRSMADSPVFARKAAASPRGSAPQPGMPMANVQISKPAETYLSSGSIITPNWSLMQSWDGKGAKPYGVSSQGLERVSLQQVPHGGIFGMTGKGKSRYFLRPFIASAIASGERVIILGKQADFWPFAQHPNVKMIPVRHITQQAEAARYAEHLRRIVEEMNRRDDYLTSHHVSTWDRAGRENTLIILDELGNALDMMPREIAQESLRWVQGLVKEGRKTGFNVWLATQRAVGFKSIVEQLGRAVFYLADADASRHALGFPGAEQLNDGHFFAKFHGVRKCAAFDPTDEQLSEFLAGRPVKIHEPIDWIEGEIVEDQPAVEATTQPVDIDAQIRTVLERMQRDDNVSLAQVEREIFGQAKGGNQYRRIQNIYIQMKTSTTTPTTTQKSPEMGTLAA